MDERLHDLRRQLDQKTTEIESLVASEQGIASIENMHPLYYERLQQDVEELLEQWEESAPEGSSHVEDTPLNRMIAERFDIEQQILAIKGKNVANEDDLEDDEIEQDETDTQWG